MTQDQKCAGHEIIDILDFSRLICYNGSMRIEKTVPEWVYELAKLSRKQSVQEAIALEPPDQIEFDGREHKRLVLRYADDILGFDEEVYHPAYADIFYVENAKGDPRRRIYILWQGWSAQWYMTMCHTEL
jgi:hypothetical protein